MCFLKCITGLVPENPLAVKVLKPVSFSAVMVVSTLPSNDVLLMDDLENSVIADEIPESIEESILREPKIIQKQQFLFLIKRLKSGI